MAAVQVYSASATSTAPVSEVRVYSVAVTTDTTPAPSASEVRVYRVGVIANAVQEVRVYRVEVAAGNAVGEWVMIGGVLRSLSGAAVTPPPVDPPPVDPPVDPGGYVAPDYGPIGSYQPGPSTTGTWRPRTKTVTGKYTVSSPNMVFTDTIFEEIHFVPTGSNALFRNCEFIGIQAAGAYGDAVGQGGASGFSMFGARFEDCFLNMTVPSDLKANVYGCGFTLWRCEVQQGVDGVDIVGIATGTNGDVTIAGCWMHNGHWQLTTTQFDGFTHNDGIQIQQQGTGTHIQIYGNYIGGLKDPADKEASDDWNNSCIIIQQETSTAAAYQIRNVDIYDNWFHGSVARINMGFKFGNNLSGVRLGPNKYIRSTWTGGPGFYILRMTSVAAVISPQNVFSDTGAAVPIQVNADG